MNTIPDWRAREIAAATVNRSPAVNGIEKWKCETCGVEWETPVDTKEIYDRTTDPSNWPVQCRECSDITNARLV